jgi:rhodanese-related sulfurtransferase
MFRKRAKSVVSVTAQDLAEMDGAEVFLVDTRPDPGERIPGTDAHIPYNEVRQRAEGFPADKGAATTAAKTLAKLGYTNVLHLKGGIDAWKKAGYEVE